MKFQMGLVGLGVMGHNLALNMERNGFGVAGYDLDPEKVGVFNRSAGAGLNLCGVDSPSALIKILDRPRRVLLMVPAGAPVDDAIAHLDPHLEQEDILIDGGNSYFMDTERRSAALEARGFRFMGAGISGGEEGALFGPSIMPGGHPAAWEAMSPVFRAIAAKAADGDACVAYMGPRGAGHYVKMVHNGIEYADMQLISEIYDFLHRGLGLCARELHEVFAEWNTGELKSYLIQITADIFTRTDPDTGLPLVDVILDEAQQKGTGKWASQNALDIGAPIPTITAAVESRMLSSLRAQRLAAAKILKGPKGAFKPDREALIEAARKALYASKITSYAQGMALLGIASAEFQYNLNPHDIARIWRGGCIIRADLLDDILRAYRDEPALVNLLLSGDLRGAVESRQDGWRMLVQTAVQMGIPVPALSSALAYYDAYRSERLPANLTQAQRDYFGAHTYRRLDRDGVFHTDWAAARIGA